MDHQSRAPKISVTKVCAWVTEIRATDPAVAAVDDHPSGPWRIYCTIFRVVSITARKGKLG